MGGNQRVDWAVSGDYCGVKLIPKEPNYMPAVTVPKVKTLVYMKAPCEVNAYLGMGCSSPLNGGGHGYRVNGYANPDTRTLWEIVPGEDDVVYLYNPDHQAWLGTADEAGCGHLYGRALMGYQEKNWAKNKWRMDLDGEFVYFFNLHFELYISACNANGDCGSIRNIYGFAGSKLERMKWVLETP